MRNGNFRGFEKGRYMYSNPHQSGLLLYEYILGFIFGSKNYLALQVVNILALLGAFYCIYKITRILFKEKKISLLNLFSGSEFLNFHIALKLLLFVIQKYKDKKKL